MCINCMGCTWYLRIFIDSIFFSFVVSSARYGTQHVLVLADFPASTGTTELEKLFENFRHHEFVIRWVNDTTALAVFQTPAVGDDKIFLFVVILKSKRISSIYFKLDLACYYLHSSILFLEIFYGVITVI